MKFKKWVKIVLVLVNMLIIMSIGNNSILHDFIITGVFAINSMLLLKYGGEDVEN